MSTQPELGPNEFPCHACGKTIVFVKTKTNKNMPIDPWSWHGEEMYDPIKHRSHFRTCSAKPRKIQLIVIETEDIHAKAVIVPKGFVIEFRKPGYVESAKVELTEEQLNETYNIVHLSR
jgi:hypothetical protein